MGRTKTSQSAVHLEGSNEKVEQILQGAMQEFFAHGYAATSMDKVAGAAGVSKATLYSYFGDKEGLFTALVEQLAQQEFQLMFNELPLDKDPKTLLHHLAKSFLENILSNPNYQNFIRLMIAESGRFPNLAKTFVSRIAKSGLERITGYFHAHPELNIPDPEATARIVMGALIHFMILQEVLHGKDVMPMESDRIIESLTYLLVNKKSDE
jgi:TetR/AcrR family transcriptional regulator of autoinduction and epiphytic fitness